MEYTNVGKNYAVVGRIGTRFDQNFVLGLSGFYGQILDPHGSFMTMTFDCTPFMKEKSPAAVHVDGTARPQIVEEGRNPSFYKTIQYYKEMTGIPSVINTSFNMHEEPIVCTPGDAIRAFLDGRLDNLAMGSFLVSIKDNS